MCSYTTHSGQKTKVGKHPIGEQLNIRKGVPVKEYFMDDLFA
jgi:hypothetical protein